MLGSLITSSYIHSMKVTEEADQCAARGGFPLIYDRGTKIVCFKQEGVLI